MTHRTRQFIPALTLCVTTVLLCYCPRASAQPTAEDIKHLEMSVWESSAFDKDAAAVKRMALTLLPLPKGEPGPCRLHMRLETKTSTKFYAMRGEWNPQPYQKKYIRIYCWFYNAEVKDEKSVNGRLETTPWRLLELKPKHRDPLKTACGLQATFDVPVGDGIRNKITAELKNANTITSNSTTAFTDDGKLVKVSLGWLQPKQRVQLSRHNPFRNPPKWVSRNLPSSWDKQHVEKSRKFSPAIVRSDLYLQQGVAHFKKNEFDKAIDAYTEVLRLYPTGAASYNRGLAYGHKGDYDKAISDFTQAIILKPKDVEAYRNRGLAYAHKGNYDKAIPDFTKVISLKPKDVEAYGVRGIIYSRKKNYDKAIADYTQLIRLRGNAEDYNSRAWILATCPEARYRDGRKAVADATKVCELTKWKSPYYFDTLAAAYAENGDFTEAVKWQKKALLDPSVFSSNVLEECRKRLTLYQDRKPYREQ